MINGVKKIKLTTHGDNRGYFREIFRFSEEFNGISIEQLSHSLVNQNVIKCWHGHVYQSQWNYVISGQLKVALYDNRKDSPDYKNFIEFFTGDGLEKVAYFFPPGVLHGYKCLSGPMHIIYATSGVYDIKDEVRISNKEINYSFI